MNIEEDIIKVLMEELYSPAGKEITPNSIVVHKSNPMFRNKIMEQGLKAKAGECYKIYVGYGVKCKPAIFATNTTNKRAWFDSTYDDDIWFIDTRMIPDIKWYKDRHFESTKKHIVTFQDIPKEAITLKYEGTGSSEDFLKSWPEDSPNKLEESIKRILRENVLKNSLMDLVNTVGIKKASKAVGGVYRLIKMLDLNDKEVNDFIYRYLTEGFYPDYNWGPELHDFYRKEIEQYGVYDFLINDVPAYAYLGEWDGYDYLYTLSITKWVIDELTTMFGDKWIPVFKKWFEENSGLEVRVIDMKNRYNVL